MIWQLNLAPLAREDKIVGLTLIYSIDSNGLLTVELSELLETINIEEDSSEVSIDILENILGVIQDFDPTGVGARNLTECLLLQLREIEAPEDLHKCCEDIITNHLHKLAGNDYENIKKSLGARSAAKKALLLIRSLNPKPGSIISPRETDYIYPDVVARKITDKWVVELNSECSQKSE